MEDIQKLLKKPSQSSWRMELKQNWMKNWDTANTTTEIRKKIIAEMETAVRHFAPALAM